MWYSIKLCTCNLTLSLTSCMFLWSSHIFLWKTLDLIDLTTVVSIETASCTRVWHSGICSLLINLFFYNSIPPFHYSSLFFRNISPCFWVCCGVPIEPRQKEKEHTIDSFKKIIDGVHVKALKWLTPHCVGIHKKWRALALLQLLPGRWTADVPLLLITHKHVLWLMNANHRSELIMRKRVHHHNILV